MLDPGHYAQWSSRFIRYVDTKPNKNQLKHCIEKGPYIPSQLVTKAVPADGDNPGRPQVVEEETYDNTTQEKRQLIDVEAEAIHMILNGIGDDIYSSVDACATTREMWPAIERLQQGEFINKQDVKTTLFWEFEWSRFVTIVKQQQDLDTVSYHMLFDILKQHQHEVNEIRADRIAMNANPLALIAADQHYPDYHNQAPKPHKSNAPSSRQTTLTRSHATTKNKGKEIVKPITHSSESASKKDSDEEYAQRDKQIQKSLALIAKHFKNIYKPTNNNLRTSSNTKNKNVDTSPRTKNDRNTRQFGNQRTVIVAENRETGEWLDDTDEEPDEQEPEAHYMYMANIQEVKNSEQPDTINDTYVMETIDNNVIPDSLDMCDNEGKADQNAEEPEDECVLLASLIANLKLDVDENKNTQKQLKKSNMSLTQELEKSKQDLQISKQDLSYCKS
ncbi:hypothetical protein Tco_0682384 [Tanacetum coccineum]|uniref:Gag-Pol polyprotein n=1 Tax=Tanacetum coccineum TaxID=301880 RepID=A0ABQ4XR01_9ASTR